jgi:AAA domain, putative AbiEii toxin, Type IV TA system/AAA ATPase domain
MYSSFSATNFRSLKKVSLDGLARLNIISGPNNSGKTTLLEALFIFSGNFNPALVIGLSALRGMSSITVSHGVGAEAVWADVFRNFDTATPISFTASEGGGREKTVTLRALTEARELANIPLGVVPAPLSGQGDLLAEDIGRIALTAPTASPQVLQLHYTDTDGNSANHYLIVESTGVRVSPFAPAPPFNAQYVGPGQLQPIDAVQRFSDLEVRGLGKEIVAGLQRLEGRLTDLASTFTAGVPGIACRMEGLQRMVPVHLMGQGFAHALGIALSISTNQSGVVLIDEIENGIHCAVLPQMWGIVSEFARRFDVQVFATTHSRECIAAALEALPRGSDELRLVRMHNENGSPAATMYDRDLIQGLSTQTSRCDEWLRFNAK